MSDNPAIPDLVVERYRFILGQISAANGAMATLLTFYHGAIAAVVAGVSFALGGTSQSAVMRSLIILALDGAILVVGILSVFVALQVIAHVFSWFDLRKEEVNLLSAQGINRAPPKWRNAWRWSELYLLVFVLATGTVAALFIGRCQALVAGLR